MIYAADDPFIYIPKPVVNNLTPETKFIVNAEGWVVLVINIVFIAVMSLGVVSLIVSGIRYITSRGDIKATQTAKTQLTYSVVALIGGIAAITVVLVILNVLGISAPGQSINNYLNL